MFFPSISFILYFLPVALLLYWLVPRSFRNAVLLVLGLAFYAWGEPAFLIPMFFLIAVNYAFGLRLAGAAEPVRRKRLLAWALALDIVVLLIVLYAERAAALATGLIGIAPPDFHIQIPLGIPFFTLQAMTYVIEIARGKVSAEKNIVHVGLFISFLPTVLFGPIVRYYDFASQIRDRKTTWEMFGSGWERFVVGLAKLLVLAAPLDRVASEIFAFSAIGNQLMFTPVLMAWLGLLAYALQLYLTFSGYSDMAIGVARMFGFSVAENFRYPYVAHTVADFWNRWHISLYRWFFVYVFMAMGGRRAKIVRIRRTNKAKNYALRNYFVLWMLLALWHGLSWNIVLFGLWFFTFTFFEWIVSVQRKDTSSPFLIFYVLFVVAIGWVFLRCPTLYESTTFLGNMLGMNRNGFYDDFALTYIREYWHVFLAGILACTPIANRFTGWLGKERTGAARHFLAACHVAVMIGLMCLCAVFASEMASAPIVKFN